MSLDKKSLTELRSIAQSIGIIPRYDVGKEQLLQDIRGHVSAKIQPPEKPIEVNITNIPDRELAQEDILKALEPFKQFGLIVTFTDDRTWNMECAGKKDSGTMAMGIWNVVQCAKEVVKS